MVRRDGVVELLDHALEEDQGVADEEVGDVAGQEVVDAGDREALEDLILAAMRDGLDKAQKLAEETMGRVTGGMDLPGFF